MGAGAALLIGGGVVKGVSSIMAGEDEKAAIRQRMLQNRLAYDKQVVNDLSNMEKLNAMQINQAGSTGFQYSGSLANLTAENINEFKGDEAAKKLNYEMEQAALDTQSQNAVASGYINAIGDFSQSAASFAEMPSTSISQTAQPSFGNQSESWFTNGKNSWFTEKNAYDPFRHYEE